MMTRQARPSTVIMGFDTHMILEAVPAPHSKPPDGHQGIKRTSRHDAGALPDLGLHWWGYVDLNHGPLPYQSVQREHDSCSDLRVLSVSVRRGAGRWQKCGYQFGNQRRACYQCQAERGQGAGISS